MFIQSKAHRPHPLFSPTAIEKWLITLIECFLSSVIGCQFSDTRDVNLIPANYRTSAAVIPACDGKIAAPETATVNIRDGVDRIKSGILNPRQANSHAANTVIALSNEKSEVRINILPAFIRVG